MLRTLAKIICLAAGSAAGWGVYTNLLGFFSKTVSIIAAGVALALVFVLLYFPLLRPIADMVTDFLIVLKQRTKRLRSGVGLGDLPTLDPSVPPRESGIPGRLSTPGGRLSAPGRPGSPVAPGQKEVVPCVICGKPGGPVCGPCLRQGTKKGK